MASKSVNREEAFRILKGLNSGDKTPITMVMELAQQLSSSVKLDFEEGTELNWNTSLFKFNVTFGDITATGEGRSKKEAKQNAARELLEVILKYESNITCLSPQVAPSTPVKYSSPSPSSSSASDTSSAVENAVGELQTIAAKNKWRLPEYEFPIAKGEAHCKTFTCLVKVKIVKMMSNLQCEGVGSTKKAAKKHAAEKMLNMLLGDEVDSPYVQECMSPLPSYNQESSSDSSILDCSDIEEYNSSDSPSHNLDAEDRNIYNIESMEKLRERSEIEGFDIKPIELPAKSKKNLYQVFLKLTFRDKKSYTVVTFGSGETVDNALKEGAGRALQHLDVMRSLPVDIHQNGDE